MSAESHPTFAVGTAAALTSQGRIAAIVISDLQHLMTESLVTVSLKESLEISSRKT